VASGEVAQVQTDVASDDREDGSGAESDRDDRAHRMQGTRDVVFVRPAGYTWLFLFVPKQSIPSSAYPDTTVTPSAGAPDGTLLAVLSGDAKGKLARIPGGIGATLRVGKADDNDLVLPDDGVSRYHLTLTRTADGLLVRDLDSTNGTRVGGARVKEAIVEPGTAMHVGGAVLVIRVDLRGAEVPPSNSERFESAIGRSIAMRAIFGLLERIAPTAATVLLSGETGTGKDVLARSVHARSPRSDHPFEVVDCGAISAALIESELFGHERGAFTGAVSAHEGAFERAQGGTLFLDEIGELPLGLQPKLLRVIEARQFRRVGGNKPMDADIRLLAATTRDLPREVEAGRFREDLYFRLAVVPVYVPPLRERKEDIPLLAHALLGSGADPPLHLSADVLARLTAYDWPGNVRELRNALERAALIARASGETELTQIGLVETRRSEEEDVFRFEDGMTYRDARSRAEAQFEQKFVRWALARHGGNIAAAAREVRMDRKYLGDLVRRHGRG